MNQSLPDQLECERLMLTYVHNVDYGNSDGVAALFTADGVWDRQGKIVEGPDNIRKSIGSNPAGLVMRHVTSNLVVKRIDDDHAEGEAYFLSYRDQGDGAAGHTLPRPLVGAAFLGTYTFRFARTAEGWRIAFHRADRVFENEKFSAIAPRRPS